MEATFQATRVTERGIHIPNIMCVARETDDKSIVIGYIVELLLTLNGHQARHRLPRISSKLTDPVTILGRQFRLLSILYSLPSILFILPYMW
jgi:hypothetical protein